MFFFSFFFMLAFDSCFDLQIDRFLLIQLIQWNQIRWLIQYSNANTTDTSVQLFFFFFQLAFELNYFGIFIGIWLALYNIRFYFSFLLNHDKKCKEKKKQNKNKYNSVRMIHIRWIRKVEEDFSGPRIVFACSIARCLSTKKRKTFTKK